MPVINPPPNVAVDVFDGKSLLGVFEGWRNFFVALFNICNGISMSGTTAQRPTRPLWVGYRYFDTTLGYPIWVQSLSPVVWVDATGAPA